MEPPDLGWADQWSIEMSDLTTVRACEEVLGQGPISLGPLLVRSSLSQVRGMAQGVNGMIKGGGPSE